MGISQFAPEVIKKSSSSGKYMQLFNSKPNKNQLIMPLLGSISNGPS
jgi:hypothetical protein